MMANPWQGSVVIMGICILIGECVFGMFGPFLFSRLGWSEPATIIAGVITGGCAGLLVSAAISHFRHWGTTPSHRPPAVRT